MSSRFTEHFNIDEAFTFGHPESRSTLSSASESVFSSSSETLNTRFSSEGFNTINTRTSLKSSQTPTYISVVQTEELTITTSSPPATPSKMPIKKKLKRFLTIRNKKSNSSSSSSGSSSSSSSSDNGHHSS